MYYEYSNLIAPLLTEASRSAIAEASMQSERLGTDSSGDLWIRSFLINSRRNDRGWAVDASTIRKNVLSIVGRPLVLDYTNGKIDHPKWDNTKDASTNFASQRKKAIGVVEKVFYDKQTDSYYADTRITDPKAREYISSFSNGNGKNTKIPIAVSPQLVHDTRKGQENFYTDWAFTHLAVVEKGAYGPQATVIGTCNGEKETCHEKLQQAIPAIASSSSSSTSTMSCPTTQAIANLATLATIPPSSKSSSSSASASVASASSASDLVRQIPGCYGYGLPPSGKRPHRLC